MLEVSGVAPNIISTVGGTYLIITGKGFGTVKDKVKVTVGGAEFVIETISDTQIIGQVIRPCNGVTKKQTNEGNDACKLN